MSLSIIATTVFMASGATSAFCLVKRNFKMAASAGAIALVSSIADTAIYMHEQDQRSSYSTMKLTK